MNIPIFRTIPVICVTLLISLCACSNQKKQKSPAKPNIIYILADDLGYGDLGCFGSTKIKTPSIDKMASEGMRFTNHYSGQTVCSPSRCALMTGMQMGHASVKRNGQLLDPDDVTVAELLKQAGYTTAAIGKWGLSNGALAPNAPNQKGFDHYFGFDNQGFAHFYYPEYMWRNHTKVDYPENLNILAEDGQYIVGKGTYIHDEFTKEALRFIQENKDKPFFLYLPYSIPHAELTVPADSRKQYEALGWPETPKVKPGYSGGGSNDQGYGSQYVKGYCAQEKPNVTYAAMVSRMDRDIGRIMDLLDALNLAENTIVLFGSDNGPSAEGGQDTAFFNSNGIFRGGKRDIYDGGVHTPFIARWRGKIKAGSESDLISHFSDFLPTACDIAGIEIPTNIDGLSLLPTFFGKVNNQKQHKFLYWEWKALKAVRAGKWKFFHMNANKPNDNPIYELYDLEADPGEQNNIATEHPELIETFLGYMEEAVK